ncbi:MAG: hypothetical protein WD470_06830 [Rhodospirillaceae bacterium]
MKRLESPGPDLIPLMRLASAVAALLLFVMAVSAVFPAQASSFRPLAPLPAIPVEVTDRNEVLLMQAELDRLAGLATELTAMRQLYDRDCTAFAFGGNARRDCQFRLVDMRRDTGRYNSAVDALDAWFQRVAAEAAIRRMDGSAGQAVGTADRATGRRLDYVREALAAGDGDGTWVASLAHLRTLRAGRAGDAALRDAAAYLEAMYRGAIAARDLANGYYRHGVHRFLMGDDWSAALAFARAARDDPGDLRVFASYALAVRRQHDSPACARGRHCVGGDVAAFAGRFGAGQADAAKRLVAFAAGDAAPDGLRAAVNRLRAAAIHAAKTELQPVAGDEAMARAVAARDFVRSGDPASAAAAWEEAWHLAEPERAEMFFRLYDGGRPEAAGAEDFAAVRTALADGSGADPFSGGLTQAQIIRLQR